jgi:hypothetical protein
LRYFARPANERVLFSVIADCPVDQIVEIGLGDASRAARLIRTAVQSRRSPIAFCGIDLFDARPAGMSRLRLKDAYCQLNIAGCKTKLVPGEPGTALAACANGLTNSDLIVIGNQIQPENCGLMWMYIPRMMSAGCQLWRQNSDGGFCRVEAHEIRALADEAVDLRRRSA